MKTIFLTLALVFSFNLSANDELLTYKNPVHFGNYLNYSDIERFLKNAISRNSWVLEKDESGRYFATILHKGYDIRNELVVDNKSVRIEFISVKCTKKNKRKCTTTEERVRGWLVKLRRTIAYDLTLLIQQDAERENINP